MNQETLLKNRKLDVWQFSHHFAATKQLNKENTRETKEIFTHWIVGMLEKIGAVLSCQTIGVLVGIF